MALKNYSTRIPAERTVAEITSKLVSKGATHVITQYDSKREPCGLQWVINNNQGPCRYMLPVNSEGVYNVLTDMGILKSKNDARLKQSQRVAWRILKDWLEAQFAIMETQMVTMEQVFLPYMMISKDATTYDAFVSGRFQQVLTNGTNEAIPLSAPSNR